MRLGLIARADNSGLGMQTWEFYRHMVPVKTMVVDISKFNHNKQYPQRYSDNLIGDVHFVTGFPQEHDVVSFLDSLDVVFVAEAAYHPMFYALARQMGVKTAVQYNYEFFDWFDAPETNLPDMFIAPSKWHFDKVDEWCREHGLRHFYLHCPVNRQELPYRAIKKARTFLHVAGRSAAHDRNGTETVIRASKYLKTEAHIKIHFQGEQGLKHQATRTFNEYSNFLDAHGGSNITMQQQEYDDYKDVYKDGDVMILPRRYGGNCLPLNEALSIGMPIIMPDISPNNQFLPRKWLIPATLFSQFEPRTLIDIYECDPVDLAAKIDEFYNLHENEMYRENITANAIAEMISWEKMKPLYYTALGDLCTR